MKVKNRPVFKGKLLSVSKRRVKMPHGHVVDLEVVKHPGAALIVPFLAEDKVILLKQFRPVINRYLYEAPAGTLKPKESFLACARREILEETGYRASFFLRLGEIFPVPGYSTEKIVMYKAWGLRKGRACFEADELIETKVVTKKEIIRLLRQGKIVDAKTICAFALCGWLA